MAYVYERFAIKGQFRSVVHQTLARDFAGDQVGMLHVLRLPDDQDLQAEMMFLTAMLPSFVAALGGENPAGGQWILTLERGPASDSPVVPARPGSEPGVSTLLRLFGRAWALNSRLEVAHEVILTSGDLLATMIDRTGLPSLDLSFTSQLRLLVAEACGYPLRQAVARFPDPCAFPDRAHDCQHDFMADICQAASEGRIAPGDEFR